MTYIFHNNNLQETIRVIGETISNLLNNWFHINHEEFIFCPHCIKENFPEPHLFEAKKCSHALAVGLEYLNCPKATESLEINLLWVGIFDTLQQPFQISPFALQKKYQTDDTRNWITQS